MSRRFSRGCLYREKRKAGPDVWVFRYRDGESNKKQQVGSVADFAIKSAAMKACEALLADINRDTGAPRTVAEMVAHYQEKELPEEPSLTPQEGVPVLLQGLDCAGAGQLPTLCRQDRCG
jgi:hypothetical protein